MGGQKLIHQYVLEQLTGSIDARHAAKRQLRILFVVSVVSALLVFLVNPSNSLHIGLAVSLLLTGIPFGVIAQSLTMRLVLAREKLHLKRFLIGKKGYIAPKDHVLQEHADLFSIAANLVCQEPFLSPNNSTAAWHTFGTLSNVQGVAVYTGWFGNSSQPSAFLYGDLVALLDVSHDIWDLGHVRKIGDSDKERFSQTAAGWKQQQLLPIGLAYATLPVKIDPNDISSNDLSGHTILLGSLGIEGSLGTNNFLPIHPSQSIARASAAQVAITLALAFLTVVSVLADTLFGVPISVHPLHILVFGIFLAPLLLAVYSWDHAIKPSKFQKNPSFSDALWSATIITALSFGIYALYLYWQGSLTPASGSLLQQSGSALMILTFGLCLLVHLALSRVVIQKIKKSEHNPLFVLTWASSLLIILILSYSSGPLLVSGGLMAVGTALFFGAIHEIRAHGNRHHTRGHILELLKTS
ncbi:hypothetical protein H0X10_03770 [Candidatus Saccharibacteria bacterium]|nr:hypothetical protein [Candidatus Saccharibacteria bacterium]